MTVAVLGLRENWRQFALLVVVSAFVGAMVGLERAVLPLVAARDFGIASAAAATSFIAGFGLTKAITNLATGWLVDRRGRRPVLIAGWILALPVPVAILVAPSWAWIVLANALLGVSQGLTWSTTVIMKIDLVGPARRGLAMGLNEFAGYLAVGGAALVSALLANQLGLREGMAWLGIAIALIGLGLSVIGVRETASHARLEESMTAGRSEPRATMGQLLRRSLWTDPRLFSLSQAGLVNNLNDGVAWGVFPLFFAASVGLTDVGWLVALYPATWGVCQLGTGALSDWWGRKPLVVAGMIVQGVALIALALATTMPAWAMSLIMLGLGTAMVYPTLLAAVSETVRPSERPLAVGVYRMWRDLGYVAGALVSGALVAVAGIAGAIVVVGVLTIASGLSVALRFPPVTAPGVARNALPVELAGPRTE